MNSIHNKIKFIKDNIEIIEDGNILAQGLESGLKRTNVIVKDLITGKVLFEGPNKLQIAGSIHNAVNAFNVTTPVILPNYNTALGLDQTITTAPENAKRVYLFGVATDGCGPESSQIFPVNYTKWTPIDKLIPFKYVNSGADINASDRTKYFGRKTASGKILYYFKKFEAEPKMFVRYVDGTIIDSNLYESANNTEAEVLVELNLRVSNTDLRDWFKANGGIETAKVNSITLLTAWEKVINGYTYYQDIQPYTKLNIQNEPLYDETKGLDIIYQLFY